MHVTTFGGLLRQAFGELALRDDLGPRVGNRICGTAHATMRAAPADPQPRAAAAHIALAMRGCCSWCTLRRSRKRSFESYRLAKQLLTNEERMKKPDEPSAESLAEIPEVDDWSTARRSPYAARLGIRTLSADLARAFPDDSSVDAALRELLASKKSA